jgi:hypothetical protein
MRAGKSQFTSAETKLFRALKSPEGIQRFLDTTRYNTKECYFCPRQVLRDRSAHCLDGALFAAAALEQIGFEPLLMDLRATNDDDHVLAVFRKSGRFGALGASNFAGLRFREPVYRSLRELAMSYFELYFNVKREKTLRQYSVLLDLRRFDHLEWRIEDAGLEHIVQCLDRSRHFDLLTPKMAQSLHLVDDRSYRAGLFGSTKAGLYKPG